MSNLVDDIDRIKDVTLPLTPLHRERSGFSHSEPFISVILTTEGYSPSIEHNKYGSRLPCFRTMVDALNALEVEAERLACEDDLLAKTLGIGS